MADLRKAAQARMLSSGRIRGGGNRIEKFDMDREHRRSVMFNAPNPTRIVDNTPDSAIAGGGDVFVWSDFGRFQVAIPNTSGTAIRPAHIYGFDSDGNIALASPGTVDPRFQAYKLADPARDMAAGKMLGNTSVPVVTGEAPTAVGQDGYLSATDAGKVTASRPASGDRWYLGAFTSITPDEYGRYPFILENFHVAFAVPS